MKNLLAAGEGGETVSRFFLRALLWFALSLAVWYALRGVANALHRFWRPFHRGAALYCDGPTLSKLTPRACRALESFQFLTASGPVGP